MAIQKVDYVASKTVYAIDWSSFEVKPIEPSAMPLFSVSVNAIWTIRKKGRVQISYGTLHEYFRDDKPANIENFMADFDGRYGGNALARWDGEYMWAPDTPLAQMVEYSKILDPMLKNIPEVPAGYEGWYKL